MSRYELINTGTNKDRIPVELSYQIIQHFSAGLYTSPNKAIEELVANSYDAWANNVYIIMPDNLASTEAIIWVVDDGNSMDVNGFKELWRIGESNKRIENRKSKKRPPIGKFGIGKLATYVLARELTYVCKHKRKYRAVSMNFEVLNRWRTLGLPITLPGSVSFHAFPHIPQGLHSPVKHVFVFDYRTSRCN